MRQDLTMRIKRAFLFFIGIIFTVGGFTGVGWAQTLKGLSTPPVDSAEAERVRIWVPVERDSKCRVVIDILNDSNRVIRHLVDYNPSRGYYNFYWDKRDDNGNRVPAGTYKSRVDNCGKIRIRPIYAQYSRWEKATYIYPADSTRPFLIRLKLLEDSARVSARVFTRGNRQLDSIMVDSLLPKGEHEIEWHAKYTVSRGNYVMKLWVGDYVYVREITYLP